MVERYSNVLLRKVNLLSWESSAAEQAVREFDVDGIPYLRVYGTRGNLLGEVRGADMDAVAELVAKEGR